MTPVSGPPGDDVPLRDQRLRQPRVAQLTQTFIRQGVIRVTNPDIHKRSDWRAEIRKATWKCTDLRFDDLLRDAFFQIVTCESFILFKPIDNHSQCRLVRMRGLVLFTDALEIFNRAMLSMMTHSATRRLCGARITPQPSTPSPFKLTSDAR